MADYIARVELHSATYLDYETLHAQMARRGFNRTIIGNNGTRYQLPTGTYVATNVSATLEDATNQAEAAAKATGKSNATIVADWKRAMFSGLKPG